MTSRERRGFRQFSGREFQALVAGSALLLAAATATVVGAQATGTTAPSTPPTAEQRQQAQDDYLNRLATNLGVTVDRLRAALQQTALQEVDAALAAGRVTAEQAQAARDRINSGDVHFGPGFGRGGPGRDGGRGGMFALHEQIATLLGITAEQLRTEQQGQSLAAVAQAHGKTRQQLIDFLVSTATAEINAAVTSGQLTQAQATERLADLRTRIEQKVDEVRQAGDRGSRSGATGSSGSTSGSSNSSTTPTATPTTSR